MMLYPNRFESLIWGLLNFDGIETDLRLNADNELVIHHDTQQKGRLIMKMSSEECRRRKIPIFTEFLQHKLVKDAYNSGKHFILEPKAKCAGFKDSSDRFFIRDKFMEAMDENNYKIQNNLHIMSFTEELLYPFKDDKIRLYPIFPQANTCAYKKIFSFMLIKPIIKFWLKSPKGVLKYVYEKGYAGCLMAFPYFYLSNLVYFQRKRAILDYAKELNLTLFGYFYIKKLEKKYKGHTFVITDLTQYYPQSFLDQGVIIAHRGSGKNNVEITTDEYNDLMSLVYD